MSAIQAPAVKFKSKIILRNFLTIFRRKLLLFSAIKLQNIRNALPLFVIFYYDIMYDSRRSIFSAYFILIIKIYQVREEYFQVIEL